MSSSPFASLSASLLARKGQAKPSKEPLFGSKPWQPPVVPAPTPVHVPPVNRSQSVPHASAAASTFGGGQAARTGPERRLTPAVVARPAEPVEAETADWTATREHPQVHTLNHPLKTTIRLTPARTRALKLAALVLDRPQQDILTAGLLGTLETLACTDLANCSCFRAVIEGLKINEATLAADTP